MAASTVSTSLYSSLSASPKRSGNAAEGGRERVFAAPYTCTAIESGSTINICTLPVGAIVTGVEAHCEGNAASSTLALAVGSTTVKAATSIASSDTVLTGNLMALAGTPLTAATLVKATTGGATLTADKKITFIVRYLLD